ncbi:hypothetical protein GOV13_02895 [Candidatus Pacearchaeota archaeon]|nr:hypothetical protein [Candidatus Pacearchaeota archaeon]
MGVMEMYAAAERGRMEAAEIAQQQELPRGTMGSINTPIFQKYLKSLQTIADIDFYENKRIITNRIQKIETPGMSNGPHDSLHLGISRTLRSFREFADIPHVLEVTPYNFLNHEYPKDRKAVYDISAPLDALIARCAFTQDLSYSKLKEKEIPPLIKILKNNPRNREYDQLISLGHTIMKKGNLREFIDFYNIIRDKK